MSAPRRARRVVAEAFLDAGEPNAQGVVAGDAVCQTIARLTGLPTNIAELVWDYLDMASAWDMIEQFFPGMTDPVAGRPGFRFVYINRQCVNCGTMASHSCPAIPVRSKGGDVICEGCVGRFQKRLKVHHRLVDEAWDMLAQEEEVDMNKPK